MQRAIGAFIGLLLVRVLLPKLVGPAGTAYFCLGAFGLLLLLIIPSIWVRIKTRRLNRKNCDNALLYARKKRRAFNEPDFRVDEVQDIKRAQKRGDVKAVYSIISLSDQRLLVEKMNAERDASAQARAQRETEQRRPAEIRLYRS